jgi:hypothetical protein
MALATESYTASSGSPGEGGETGDDANTPAVFVPRNVVVLSLTCSLGEFEFVTHRGPLQPSTPARVCGMFDETVTICATNVFEPATTEDSRPCVITHMTPLAVLLMARM